MKNSGYKLPSRKRRYLCITKLCACLENRRTHKKMKLVRMKHMICCSVQTMNKTIANICRITEVKGVAEWARSYAFQFITLLSDHLSNIPRRKK